MKKPVILLSLCSFLVSVIQVLAFPQSAGDLYSTDAIIGIMRYVPSGFYIQGSPTTEPGHYAYEYQLPTTDEHQFTHLLTKNLAVMETEITKQMWDDLRALYPSLPPTLMPEWWGASGPAIHLAWYEAVLYANILSLHNGLSPCYFKDNRFTVLLDPSNYRTGPYFFNPEANGYRLPTEGEWEYFCRAGTTGPFSIDEPSFSEATYGACAPGALPALETVAWFCANAGGTRAVGLKAPNPWNLKDVHGNTMEWCWDQYGPYPAGLTAVDFAGAPSGELRVARGGAGSFVAGWCRSADRFIRPAYFHHYTVGFRLVRSINVSASPHITVTSPAGGEGWWTGSAQVIGWTAAGDIDNVKIDYSTDNGSSWLPVAASIPNIGQYSWVVPGTTSPTCLVRVADAAVPGVSGASAASFSIVPVPPPSIDLSRVTVRFYAGSGQTSLPPQWVTVRNPAGGSLAWSASASEGWFSVTPSSGSGDGLIRIDADPSGMSPGYYYGLVSIADPQALNSPRWVHVSVIVSESATEPYFATEFYVSDARGDPRSVAALDFDGDGDRDVVYCGGASGDLGSTVVYPRIRAMRNDGQGRFVDITDEVFVGVTVAPSAFLIPGDFNGDGREDLYLAESFGDGDNTGGQDLIFIQTPDGRLVNEWESRLPVGCNLAAWAGDVDGDRDLDIFCSSGPYHNEPYILLNDGAGRFTPDLGRLPSGSGFKSLACALIDYDKDGDLDIYFGKDRERGVILVNDGSGHFTAAPPETLPPTALPGQGATMNAVVADFDADGWPDIATTVLPVESGTATIQLFLNNQDGTFLDGSSGIPSTPARVQGAGDFNGDGWMDLICSSTGGAIYLNQGNAVFTEVDPPLIPADAIDVSWGAFYVDDIDDDGDMDLLNIDVLPHGEYRNFFFVYRNLRPCISAPPVPYPEAPVLATPADGSMVGTTGPTLAWLPVNTAFSYELEVAADEGFGSVLISYAGITPTSAQVGPLENDTIYYWRVRATNTRGVGPWSAVFDFSISPITVTAPDGGENWPVGTTQNITWTSKNVAGDVSLGLYRSGAFHSPIGTAAAAAGTYAWPIPSGLPEGNDFRVRIYQGAASDYSEADFSTYREGIISGHITACGTPLAGAIMAGLPGEPETDEAGFYSISVPYGWSGTVVPVHPEGHIFEPASTSYTNVTADQTSDYVAFKGILPREREILIALYNSTNGPNWPPDAQAGWKTPPLEADGFGADGTEGSWSGVAVGGVGGHRVVQLTIGAYWLSPAPQIPPALGELTALVNLQFHNGFTGEIPTELGNLNNLEVLWFSQNMLAGTIPSSFVNLTKLGWLYFGDCQLAGPIPTFLGGMNSLGSLALWHNQFSGSIPAELGNLSGLNQLLLECNNLTGVIPANLTNLTNLQAGGLSLANNGVHASDPTLLAFLAVRAQPGWADTQTLAPANVQAVPLGSTAVTVSWTPIAYTGNGGGYRVSYSTSAGGPYAFFGQTASKLDASLQVTGLTPGTTYYFIVETRTGPVYCGWFPNTITSEPSAEASATTLPLVVKEDFVATWDGQGVYYRNSDTGGWVKMASPATMITTGDLDGDGVDDLIGLWPGQGGIWVKYSQSGLWARLSSTAVHIASGDMNGDGREDLLGTWDGQGVFYRNSLSGAWIKMASPATMITTGDIDDDGTDDLIGIWPSQGGVWVKYSHNGAWARLSSTARDISTGDANGDGRDDLLATWDGQGVYYRDSASGAWVRMASEATQVTCGDLDADGKSDLIGIWPTQGGVWVKYSQTSAWALLGSTARDLSAGVMRTAGALSVITLKELPQPLGGTGVGPEMATWKEDRSDQGPGGAKFAPRTQRNLVPTEGTSSRLSRVPGPGEPGFKAKLEKNLQPGGRR